MSNVFSVNAGAGVPPLVLTKSEDGSVVVDPLFSGVRIPEESLEDFAKFLLSSYEEPTVDLSKDGEQS